MGKTIGRMARQIGAGLVTGAMLGVQTSSIAQRVDRDAAVPIQTLPSNRIQRTITNFGEALSCMDDLFLQYGKTGLVISAGDIPDKTEQLKSGTRDMLISAIDSMSIKSKAFVFVDAENDDLLSNAQAAPFDFYIKGSITNVDANSVASSKKAGISFSPVSLGIAADRQVGQIGMDLGMYLAKDRTAVPGVRTQNTVLLVNSSKGADLEGLLPFASLLFSVRKDVNQTQGASIRSLIQLSLIELLGKFTKVPYWQCLALPSADPLALRTATDYFGRMSPRERIAATQTALRQAGTYAGPVDGVESPELKLAVSRYRAEKNLGAGTAIDPQLYFSFLVNSLPAKSDVAGLAPSKAAPAALAPPPDRAALDFTMTVPTTLRVKQPFRITLKPSQDAYFYCFMAGSDKNSAIRIYPNRFTGTQPLTPAGTALVIPADNFKLAFDAPGTEEVACVARTQPYEEPFPPSLRVAALTAEIESKQRLSGVAAVVNEHQARDPRGLTTTARMARIAVIEPAP